jgi:hypothetical protein
VQSKLPPPRGLFCAPPPSRTSTPPLSLPARRRVRHPDDDYRESRSGGHSCRSSWWCRLHRPTPLRRRRRRSLLTRTGTALLLAYLRTPPPNLSCLHLVRRGPTNPVCVGAPPPPPPASCSQLPFSQPRRSASSCQRVQPQRRPPACFAAATRTAAKPSPTTTNLTITTSSSLSATMPVHIGASRPQHQSEIPLVFLLRT